MPGNNVSEHQSARVLEHAKTNQVKDLDPVVRIARFGGERWPFAFRAPAGGLREKDQAPLRD